MTDASVNRVPDSPGEAAARCDWCHPNGYDYCDAPCPNLARNMAIGRSIPNSVDRCEECDGTGQGASHGWCPECGGSGRATRNRVQSQASLSDQLDVLQKLAVQHGLYDAHDWMMRQIR